MYPSVTCGFLSLEKSFSLKNKLSLPFPPPLPHLLTGSSALKCSTREGRWARTAGHRPFSQLWRLSPGKGQTCPQGHVKLLEIFSCFTSSIKNCRLAVPGEKSGSSFCRCCACPTLYQYLSLSLAKGNRGMAHVLAPVFSFLLQLSV